MGTGDAICRPLFGELLLLLGELLIGEVLVFETLDPALLPGEARVVGGVFWVPAFAEVMFELFVTLFTADGSIVGNLFEGTT